MAKTYKTEFVALQVDDSKALRVIDKIHNGAAKSWLSLARGRLSNIVADGHPVWPEKTARSKNAFKLRDDVTETQIGVTALNTAKNRGTAYGYKLRFSRRTEDSLEAEAMRIGRGGATASEKPALKWRAVRLSKELGRHPSSSELGLDWLKRITKFHGTGAPDATLQGRHAWSWLIARPARQQTPALIEDAQKALDALSSKA